MPLVTITADIDGIDGLINRLGNSAQNMDEVHKTVIKYANEVRRIATTNVSGVPVTFNGKSFVVNRVTGKLARSIQIVDMQALSATIEAMAEYSGAVEAGHKAIDLKRTMHGKTIPLTIDGRGKNAQQLKAMGAKTVQQYATTGRLMGTKTIIFRKVGSKGWIIPAALPRPFMAAAGEAISKDFSQEIGDAVTRAFTGSDKMDAGA